ncbi:MAG: methyltransferase domain-containing protein [Myxococcales bacterium]|nr:methyltransferase domain-containing protein [Myxococcales bacterium]
MSEAFDAFERAAWDSNDASAYEALFGPITSQVVEPLLDAVRAGRGSRVLDVATGPGYVAGRAAARGATVTGLDRSAQMLAIARARHPAVTFVEGNAEALDFPAASFDAAVASFCLLHLASPERAAAELARVVVPGGRVAVTVWNTPDRARLMGVVPESARAAGAIEPADLPAGPAFFRFADDAEMRRLLTGAGLHDAEVLTIEWRTWIPSLEHLWRGFADGTARTRALLAAQPADVQARIRGELAHALEPYREGDAYSVPVSVKLGAATRR